MKLKYAVLIVSICFSIFFTSWAYSLNSDSESGALQSNSNFRVGAGSAVIDIPDTFFPAEGFTGVHDQLFSKTLLIENGVDRIALIVIDLTSIGSSQVNLIKESIKKIANIDPSNIFVCASHTFSSPHIIGGSQQKRPEEIAHNNLLQSAIDESVNKSVIEAKENMVPAKVGFGTGTSNVSANRDILTADGWWFGHDEHGISDKQVSVIKFEDLTGKPLAILMNYAVQSSIMNESVMEEGGKLVTADLGGSASNYVEKQFVNEPVSIFTIGAAGDQKPFLTSNYYSIDGFGKSIRTDLHDNGFILVDLLGEYLGSEVVRVSQKIQTVASGIPLRVVNESIKCKGQSRPRNIADIHPTKQYTYHEAGEVDVPISIMQIGDIVLVGVQTELNAKTGRDIKKNSPFKNTIVMTMVNGAAKYMADKDSYEKFTYEAINSGYGKGSAEIVEEKIISMLNHLYNMNISNHIKSVTAVTEVFGNGQKISAVAVEYDKNISSSDLSKSTFSVEGRTITNIYTSDSAAKGSKVINGKYIILELSPSDKEASLFVQSGRTFVIKEAKISLKQTEDIIASDGEKYSPSNGFLTNTGVINLVVDEFRQFEYIDPETGETLKYNLFIPENYNKNRSYPLVMFIHDAGVLGPETKTTLIQGNGGTVWATKSEQSKHASFVLAPQFERSIVNDQSQTTSKVDITVSLINSITNQYNIDKNRIYATGQSMGCMTTIAINIKYPDLFAAAFLVAGQWDATLVSPLVDDKLWILVSEGDLKALPGMNDITAALEKQGAKVSRAIWNGRAGETEFAAEVSKMKADGSNIKYVVLKKGTVVPEGIPETGGSNHVSTWPIAYNIAGIRDWLFEQRKP